MPADINWCGKWVKHLMMFDVQPPKTLSFRVSLLSEWIASGSARVEKLTSRLQPSRKLRKVFAHTVGSQKPGPSVMKSSSFRITNSHRCESILASAAKCTSTLTDSIDLSSFCLDSFLSFLHIFFAAKMP